MDTWRAAYRGIVPDAHLDGLSYDESERLWQDTIMAGDGCVFVAEDECGVFGFASGGPRERFSRELGEYEGELQTVYVLPSHKGTGAGRRLVRSPDISRTTAWTPCSCGCSRRTAPRAASTSPSGARL